MHGRRSIAIMASSKIERAIEGLVVLVADSNAYMRRLIRVMLINSGVKAIYEAGDGGAALEQIRNLSPDVLIIEWDLPVLSGAEVMRIVRSPGVFPKSNLPIIILTEDSLHSRVLAAARLGAHEFLVKPVSAKLLQERLLDLVLAPRPMVRTGTYYVPMPRRHATIKDLMEAAAEVPGAAPEYVPEAS
jgi:CheY-like chemotaxis protein